MTQSVTLKEILTALKGAGININGNQNQKIGQLLPESLLSGDEFSGLLRDFNDESLGPGYKNKLSSLFQANHLYGSDTLRNEIAERMKESDLKECVGHYEELMESIGDYTACSEALCELLESEAASGPELQNLRFFRELYLTLKDPEGVCEAVFWLSLYAVLTREHLTEISSLYFKDRTDEDAGDLITLESLASGDFRSVPDAGGEEAEGGTEIIRVYQSGEESRKLFDIESKMSAGCSVRAIGISLTALREFSDKKYMKLLKSGANFELILLDPHCESTQIRENEEGVRPGSIAEITRSTIDRMGPLLEQYLKQKGKGDLYSEGIRLYLYTDTPRCNMIFIDNEEGSFAFVQFYANYTKGKNNPTFLIQKTAEDGLYDFYLDIYDQAKEHSDRWNAESDGKTE